MKTPLNYRKRMLVAIPVYLGLVIIICAAIVTPVFAQEKPVIAAASSLNGVLDRINKTFNEETNEQVRISFGSSGNLTRQIIQGAPFELFLSADKSYVAALYDRGLADGSGDVYAVGRLVLFVPTDSTLLIDPSLEDLRTALVDGRLKRLAIANPEHAPYGRAAQEVLQNHLLWLPLQGRLLFAENVAQAAQFTVSGDVDAGIISYSIALEPAMTDRGTFVLLPDSWHQSLRHHMVLLNTAGTVSRSFYTYLLQPTAQEIFQKFGFSTLANSQ